MFKMISGFDESILSKNKSFLIAVSGGVDSMVLLYNMYNLGYKVRVLIIDHNLRESSENEALNAQNNILESLSNLINIDILKWNHNGIESAIEEKARKFRYEQLNLFAKKYNIDCICLGHNKNDQIETFFLNLSRGSGLEGLACMPRAKLYQDVYILRPMLSVAKKDIIDYAVNNKIKWIEDPTNSQLEFTRNKIRNFLASISPNEDKLDERVFNSIELIQESNELLKKYMLEKFDQISIKKENSINILCSDFFKLNQYEKFVFVKNSIYTLLFMKKYIRSEKILNIIDALMNQTVVKRSIGNDVLIYKNESEITFKTLEFKSDELLSPSRHSD